MTALSQAACQLAAMAFDPASNVHTVYEGEATENGKPTGEPAVVALVREKLPESVCRAYNLPTVPHSLEVGNGATVRVDVQEAPETWDGAPFRIQILNVVVSTITTPLHFSGKIYGAIDHQRCFSPLIPGGVQISPGGASHVGTVGIPWTWEGNRFGFLTNRHVAGLDRQLGDRVCQPHGQANPIGYLAHFEPLNTVDPNELDLAIYDCELNGKHYVSQGEIFGIGRIKPGVVDLAVGDSVSKSGRTTGVTQGRVVGKNASTSVNYGPGRNLLFRGLDLIETPGGSDFSAPGDSGGACLKDGAFASLLFAGGNGKTLAIPARRIQEKVGGGPFA